MVFTGRLWITFGLFLLGMVAGRLEIFRDTEANRRFFRRLLWPAAAVALVTTVVEIVHPTGFQMNSVVDLLASFSFIVQQVSLSAFYVAAVTLLYWRRPSNGLLPALAPLGRMGLTTYLGQTVFGLLLFYGLGFGMLGKLGVAAAVGAAIAFYILQILLARAWMTRFRLGPVEWLWRSLTYFKLQPNSRRSDLATDQAYRRCFLANSHAVKHGKCKWNARVSFPTPWRRTRAPLPTQPDRRSSRTRDTIRRSRVRPTIGRAGRQEGFPRAAHHAPADADPVRHDCGTWYSPVNGRLQVIRLGATICSIRRHFAPSRPQLSTIGTAWRRDSSHAPFAPTGTAA